MFGSDGDLEGEEGSESPETPDPFGRSRRCINGCKGNGMCDLNEWIERRSNRHIINLRVMV